MAKELLFQKVAIFVDAENIEMSSLKHHEGRTDYKKILSRVGDREILRILYYKPAYKDISAEFEHFWGSLGGEIRRPTKNADTFLVIDAVTMAEKIDVAIILGGDKDFLPLVWYLRSRGCRVEVWSWPETTSPEFQQAADFYFPLTKEFVMTPGATSSATREPKAPREGHAPRETHPPRSTNKQAGNAPQTTAPAAAAPNKPRPPKNPNPRTPKGGNR